MVETIEKATLEDMVKTAYEPLNTLLASLSEEQKTPGVKSSFVAMRALRLGRRVCVGGSRWSRWTSPHHGKALMENAGVVGARLHEVIDA